MNNSNHINFIKGDATESIGSGNKLIVHICNNIGKWNKGFVNAITKKWTLPKKYYHEKMKKYKLGTVQIVKVEKDIWIGNMIAQNGINRRGYSFKRRVDYDKLSECLDKVNSYAKSNNATVHMPMIGTGLGGGEWEIIKKIIKSKLCEIGVYVYKLE